MPRDWEDTFRRWSGPSSDTEEEKRDRAERLIGDGIRESDTLAIHEIRVFTQGSYKNNTNVRADSDVDICVCCTSVFFSDFSMVDGFTKEDVGLVDSSYTYANRPWARQALARIRVGMVVDLDGASRSNGAHPGDR